MIPLAAATWSSCNMVKCYISVTRIAVLSIVLEMGMRMEAVVVLYAVWL